MNRITSLFGIQYPIIQGGMVWCSGWRLASAVSNAGGLGLLGAGSMHPETLREHIRKCRAATDRPFGVNIPLMYPQIEEIMRLLPKRASRSFSLLPEILKHGPDGCTNVVLSWLMSFPLPVSR